MDMAPVDMTPKVLLDTNMVYYICGLSTSDHISVSKVVSYIEENQSKMNFAISSVSFYELLVRYQKKSSADSANILSTKKLSYPNIQ